MVFEFNLEFDGLIVGINYDILFMLSSSKWLDIWGGLFSLRRIGVLNSSASFQIPEEPLWSYFLYFLEPGMIVTFPSKTSLRLKLNYLGSILPKIKSGLTNFF